MRLGFGGLALAAALLAAPAPPADELKPRDHLLAAGRPPIPLDLAREVQRYTDSRSATLFDWHPAAREVLVGTRFAASTQVHHVRSPGGARTQLTFSPEGVAAAS